MKNDNKFLYIRRILILILVLNWAIALSKIIYGLITKCVSMTADGVHSFGDGASNIIGLIGIWLASKPKDESHPYGHKKFETFATLGTVAILFLASFNILKEALSRLFNPVMPDVNLVSFIVMFLTMAINIFIVRYEHAKGKELSSDILTCDALHTKSDIFASIAVIGTLISIKMGFWAMDIIVAASISLLIARSAFLILKASSKVLCDGNVLVETRITDVVKKVKGVKSIHNVRTRGREDDIHVDLHVTIDKDMHVDKAHSLSHDIQEALRGAIKGITEVSVHLEPHNHK
ncbi:MAG: cation diffusion facilitator family transporter [Candidatus Omnitrophota bacterium]